MRRLCLLAALALVVVACDDGASDEPVTTTSTTSATSTTQPVTTTEEDGTTTTSGAATTTTTLPPLEALRYEVLAELPFPLLVTARSGSAVAYVLSRGGRVWSLSDGRTQLVMDISDRVFDSGQEQGLLGMALHPSDDDRVFLHYTGRRTGGGTVVSEFRFAADGTIDPGSERVVLTHDQPAANHNGGMIQFGPDGHLYLGLGDGGGAGDTFGNGQNTSTILGGIVRIDVERGDTYAIPADNPFVEEDGADALWAYGLRNPWRFWIDHPEDTIYIADVGQNAFEEINVVPLSEAGGANFGWPITEGTRCFSPQTGCDTSGLRLPVIEVTHGDAGACSITGGVVYRGSLVPELEGHYLYSDWCGGWLRSFRWDGSQVTEATDWTDQVGVPGRVTSFGVDGAGEVYVTTSEAVLRLVAER